MPWPKLDHFVGRSVNTVVSPVKKSAKGWKWGLQLEGQEGLVIRNYSDEVAKPKPPFEGCLIGVVTMSDNAHEIQLFKGQEIVNQISLVPGEYKFYYGDLDLEYDYEPEANDLQTPDDPSPLRVAEGPEVQDENEEA